MRKDLTVLLAPDADEVSLFSLAPKRTLISNVYTQRATILADAFSSLNSFFFVRLFAPVQL
jgi:hypothetical protein